MDQFLANSHYNPIPLHEKCYFKDKDANCIVEK